MILDRPEPGVTGAWTVDADVEHFPFLADHRLRGAMVLPGAAIVEMALGAAAATGRSSSTLEDVCLERMCVLPESGSRRLRVALTKDVDLKVTVTSGPDDRRTTHAVVRLIGPSPRLIDVSDRAQAVRQTGAESSGDDYYRVLGALGNDYGPAFRTLRRIWRGDGEALADVHAGSAELARLLLIDAAVQVVAAAVGLHDQPFVWTGCERVQVFDVLAADGQAYARLRSPAGAEEVAADAVLLDCEGRVAAEMTGVRLRRVRTRRARTLAVAVTFDAGPLLGELRSRMAALGVRVLHERGESVADLIGPRGLLASNRDGVNVLLVRPGEVRDSPGRFLVPGLGAIAHLHGYETEYLYDEIFVQKAYLRNGITLRPGDTVIDIGANIGMFALFVTHNFPGVRVYAFEPAPPPFDALRENVTQYCPDSQAFNYGVSGENGVKPFTFYRNSTVFSGFAADPERDARTIRTVVENVLHAQFPGSTLDLRPVVSRLLRDRLVAVTHPRPTRTLSTVLREVGIDRIDLLKIDTEGSETEVLQGIEDRDWERIRQVVLEVHGSDEQRQAIVALLEERGFEVLVDRQEHLLRGTALTTVVARRPDDRSGRASEPALGTVVTRPPARRAAYLVQAVAALQRGISAPCVVCVPGGRDLVSELPAVPGVVVVTDETEIATTAARLLSITPAPRRG